MKRKLVFFICLPLLVFIVFTFSACRSEIFSRAGIRGVVLTWIPNKELRGTNMEIDLDGEIRDIFLNKLAASSEIDPVWLTKLVLLEGAYEITLMKNDGKTESYHFGGESILYAPSTKKYYQNKDLHLFIYQILFREFVKQKISLNDRGRAADRQR